MNYKPIAAKCIQTSNEKMQHHIDSTGLLTVNAETHYGSFFLDDSDATIQFSVVKDVQDDGKHITLTTRNSTWIFERTTDERTN